MKTNRFKIEEIYLAADVRLQSHCTKSDLTNLKKYQSATMKSNEDKSDKNLVRQNLH
jgi:hypothetical protein